MIKEYLAGIDIGTTGAKVAIFDLCGNMISSSYHEYECMYPKPNWVDQDLNVMFASTMRASKECMAKPDIENSAIAAISLSSQRSCTIFLDKDGREVVPMISWQDGRAVHEVEDMKRIIEPEAYYTITGLPLGTTWGVAKNSLVKKINRKNGKKLLRLYSCKIIS